MPTVKQLSEIARKAKNLRSKGTPTPTMRSTPTPRTGPRPSFQRREPIPARPRALRAEIRNLARRAKSRRAEKSK